MRHPVPWLAAIAAGLLTLAPPVRAASPPPCCAVDAQGLAPVSLVDQAGARVTLPDGRPWILTFFYGSCKDVCPLLLYHLKDVADRIPADDKARIGFGAVSFDPARDTPDQLARLAENFELAKGGFHLLTGQPAALGSVFKTFGFDYRADGSGGYKHVNLIAVMDGRGHVVKHFYGLSPDLDAVAATARAALH